MRAAVIQLNSQGDQKRNIHRASELIDQAAAGGAKFVVLPEYMPCLGDAGSYDNMCTEIKTTSQVMSNKARQHGIYLHTGSMIEKSSKSNVFYNSSLVFDPQGREIACYRKIHIFETGAVDALEEFETKEILCGDHLVLAPVEEFTVGLSIGLDLRFPEIFREQTTCGANVLAVPAAFPGTSGPEHWEVLLRARAIENLAYVMAAGQCGQDGAGIWHHGHSMIIDPWGTVLTSLDEEEGIAFAEPDIEQVRLRREQLPIFAMRRPSRLDTGFH